MADAGVHAALSGLGGRPHAGHQMGFRPDAPETGAGQSGLDVITDLVAVVGLVKHPAEVVHDRLELG